MAFKKLKVKLLDSPRVVSRTFIVDDKILLKNLCIGIISSFNAGFEHMFMLNAKDISYVDKSWIENFGEHNFLCYDHFSLDGLVKRNIDNFTILYDTGENYTFEVEVNDTDKVIKDEWVYDDELDEDVAPQIECIKARGLGIFENNHYGLNSFLKGYTFERIAKSLGFDEEYLEEIVPYNLNLDFEDTLDKYFEKIDLEELNSHIQCDLFSYNEYHE